MPLIRFKTRSLIRRFGTAPVEMNEGLVQHYVDRGQAIKVKEVVVKDEETGEETTEVVGDLEDLEEKTDSDEESPPDEEQASETEDDPKDEEKVEVKIKKPKKAKKK